MPRLSIWAVRLALINFITGFTFGMLMLWNKGMFISGHIWRLLPAHMALLLLGWTAQLILGVAFWILPRWRSSRGDTRPAWAAVIFLNLGVWLVAAAPFLAWLTPLSLLGRTLEAAAAALFALHAWPRVKPPAV